MTRNRTIALIVAIAALVLAGVWLTRNTGTVSGTAGEAGSNVKTSGQAQVGGPFTLTDQTGKTVTDQDFRGKYMLIYFGFTFCPDVCPTELQAMASAIDQLGDKGADVVPIFVTVDPDRDTPEALARYVRQFHPRLVGLTGTHEQIAAIAKAYRVYYQKVKEEGAPDDSYTMDHSSVAYLMGPDGKFLAFFPPGVTPDQMAEKIGTFL